MSLFKQTWLYSGFLTHPIKSELITHGERVDMQEKQPNSNTEKVEYLDKNKVNEKLRKYIFYNRPKIRLTITIIFPTYTATVGKQCSVFMPKYQIAEHLYRNKCSFFPNCKRILCITTFELLRTSS